jgi:hypothetical protein
MHPVLSKTLRNRWFIIGVHAGLWCLLYLAVRGVGGKAPDYRDADSVGNPAQSPAPVAGLDHLFSPGIWPKSLTTSNLVNAFYTPYFIPAVAPPPTTRTIEVTYSGFNQTGDGPPQAYFKLGGATLVAPVGARVTADLFIAGATVHSLTLTNIKAQTNIVPLNTKKEIVVPIR